MEAVLDEIPGAVQSRTLKMKRGRFPIWLKIVALAPLLTLVVALPSQALVRCHMDGQLRVACCCPSPDAERTPTGPAISASDCCDRILLARDHQPSEQARASQSDVERAVAIVFAGPAPDWSPEERVGIQAFTGRGPPGGALDLVLLKHAFLI